MHVQPLGGRGGAQALASAVGLSKQQISSIRQGRSVGSVIGNTRMFFYKAGLTDQEAKEILENSKAIISNIEKPDSIDLLVTELKGLYEPNELSAWLRLLIDKKTVEKNLSVTIKVSLKKSKGKKKSS